MQPFFIGSMNGRLKGTGIPMWQSSLGFREAPQQVESPSLFLKNQGKLDQKNLKMDRARQIRENRFLETPRPVPGVHGKGGRLTPEDIQRFQEFRRRGD
jgi:hypothetical protein